MSRWPDGFRLASLEEFAPTHTSSLAIDIQVVDRASPLLREIAERLRREYGLTLTSRSQPEETEVPTQNPYDRREPRRSDQAIHGDNMMSLGYAGSDILDDGRRAYQGFSLYRLEELLRDEFARGYNAGEGTMERKLEEEILPRAKRTVWAEGHEAGCETGRAHLLKSIADLWEDKANDMVRAAREVLAKEDKATKRELAEQVAVLGSLVAALVESHHEGFAAF